MSPVKYIERTREHFATQGFPPYQWTVSQTAPWTPFTKRLEDCRVALISSGGVYISGKQQPFNPERDDLTFREVPKDIDVKELAISHNHYDHSDAEKDINVVFPIERLRELEEERFIGSVSPVNFGFMGRIFRRRQLETEMAPQIVARLKENNVDVFLLVPAWPLCHQSVGLIARVVEASGIPTISISAARDITEAVKPPRSVFLNFPMGRQAGKPFDKALQTKILKDALNALKTIDTPGAIVDLPYEWTPGDNSWEDRVMRDHQQA